MSEAEESSVVPEVKPEDEKQAAEDSVSSDELPGLMPHSVPTEQQEVEGPSEDLIKMHTKDAFHRIIT